MLLNVYCPVSDLHFSVYVGSDLKLKEFKSLCAQKCGVSVSKQQLFLDNNLLVGDNKSLKSLHCTDNGLIVLQTENNDATPYIATSRFAATSSSYQSSGADQSSGFSTQSFRNGLSDPKSFKMLLLENPNEIQEVKSIYPPVIDAMLSEDKSAYSREFYKFCDLIGVQPLSTYDDVNNVETQRQIHNEIKRKNIDENMAIAMETTPESYSEVTMLWINIKVNGHPLKAFVDTGAQMTILSTNCAKKCNLQRLIDKRWEGIATGVGVQKIVGRIHLAQVQIEKTVMPCAFAVLDNQPMDMLFGLDMMKRHACVVDLKDNSLVFGSCHTKTYFLPPTQLPSMRQYAIPFAPFPSASCQPNKKKSSTCLSKLSYKSCKKFMRKVGNFADNVNNWLRFKSMLGDEEII